MPVHKDVLSKAKRPKSKPWLGIIFIALLISINLSIFTSAVQAAPGGAPAPQPCFNPEPVYVKDAGGNFVLDANGQKVENLTDNYLTDTNGDPLGPEETDNKLTNPEALKFTIVYTGHKGDLVHLTKRNQVKVDFSKLQAIFGAPNSNFADGGAQSIDHAQTNLMGLKNPLIYQGPAQKAVFKVLTDAQRIKYVKYVYDKPELGESGTKFTDYNGQDPKNIHELVGAFSLPSPPPAGTTDQHWLDTWAKYWEKLPTTYNEFTIGKLEFRELHGLQLIENVKKGVDNSCSKFNPLRTVEFPVPNFFRTAATSGALNQVLVPKTAQSDQNDLLDIKGAVLGVKTSTLDFLQYCIKFAQKNPVSQAIKKVISLGTQSIKSSYIAYAAWNLNLASVGSNSARFTFDPPGNGNFGLVAKNNSTGQTWDSGAISNGTSSVTFNGLTPGNYRAVLIFATSEISNAVTFDINSADPSPQPTSSWTLSVQASPIRGSNVRFDYNPEANSVMALIVYDQNNNTVTDSGSIDRSTTWTWTNARPGVYHAQLFAYGIAPVSNVVNFEVQWLLNNPTVDIRPLAGINNVNFTFAPQGNNDGANLSLLTYVNTTPRGTAFYDSAVSGVNLNGQTSHALPLNKVRWGKWVAVLIKGLSAVSNEVTYEVPYVLEVENNSGSVTFHYGPPLHIGPPSANAMAIIVKRKYIDKVVWDSGPLALDSTSVHWTDNAQPGDMEACLLYDGKTELSAHNLVCKPISVSTNYPWKIITLDKDKSCIKVSGSGKAGNAPFCAIYPTKFEPSVKGQTNVFPGECADPNPSRYKLNDQSNVVCTFTFDWDSSKFDGIPDKELRLPASGPGNWDKCDYAGDFVTCYLTVGIWPDFRVPFLAQSWNNTQFSNKDEVLPTLQETGRPGYYTFGQPKAVAEYDPLQELVNNCDPAIPGSQACKDLVNKVTSGDYPTKYPGLSDCVTSYLMQLPQLVTCIKGVASLIPKNLPGQVDSSTLGASTGPSGSVLGTATDQKERFIGAVDCGKHLTRDISLKPLVLQKELGVKFDCDLSTSSETPPNGAPPPPPGGGTPTPTPPPPPPGGGTPPTTNDCSGKYNLSTNPLNDNFGDPSCDFSESQLYDLLRSLDPSRADYWFFTIVPCESVYNSNNYNGASTSGSAWGLYQMGHEAYPTLGIPRQMNSPFDRGDVDWRLQTSNAVNYNNGLGNTFDYWGCAT